MLHGCTCCVDITACLYLSAFADFSFFLPLPGTGLIALRGRAFPPLVLKSTDTIYKIQHHSLRHSFIYNTVQWTAKRHNTTEHISVYFLAIQRQTTDHMWKSQSKISKYDRITSNYYCSVYYLNYTVSKPFCDLYTHEHTPCLKQR